jgi:hypothetical protein
MRVIFCFVLCYVMLCYVVCVGWTAWLRPNNRRRNCPEYLRYLIDLGGPDSSVGIPTGYGLEGPGIEFRWGEIFRICPDRPWCPPSLLYNGYQVVPGGKVWPGRDADQHPLLVPRS